MARKANKKKVGYELRVWRTLPDGTEGWYRCGVFASRYLANKERLAYYANSSRFTIMGVRVDTTPIAVRSDTPATAVVEQAA